ncbi:hypothetical protein KP509_12G015000 [Ceratopteris richardii]|uniref:Acid phosphatase n=1 Tax=Ceratopteris richardii TaxID=49495 RepID=A0A8T2TL80_CERRI|nr:hypothetical protein KP509_12G015000 [Ceratopteris richardii]
MVEGTGILWGLPAFGQPTYVIGSMSVPDGEGSTPDNLHPVENAPIHNLSDGSASGSMSLLDGEGSTPDELHPVEYAPIHNLSDGSVSGYQSLYSSFFGSHLNLGDGSGINLSSSAINVIISVLVAFGIFLVTVFIILTVMLSACEQKHSVMFNDSSISKHCISYRLNLELNNIQESAVPSECLYHFSHYVHGDQYIKDFEAVIQSARNYLKGLKTCSNENYTLVLDIDETALSNFLSPTQRVETFMSATPIKGSQSIPLVPMLDLYNELSAANWHIIFLSERPTSAQNATVKDLLSAGFTRWTLLILRSENEASMTVKEYKSKKRMELEQKGYHIKSVIGDQWSDITGPATGDQRFKLPNPIYQVL